MCPVGAKRGWTQRRCWSGKFMHARRCCHTLPPPLPPPLLQGHFGPSDLLCPKAKCWVPLERVEAALDEVGRWGEGGDGGGGGGGGRFPGVAAMFTAVQWGFKSWPSHAFMLDCRCSVLQPGAAAAISELPGALEGLGAEHLVDAATGRPTCPPAEVRGGGAQ